MFSLALTALGSIGVDLRMLDGIAGPQRRRAAALLVAEVAGLRDLGAGVALGGWLAPTMTLWGREVMD